MRFVGFIVLLAFGIAGLPVEGTAQSRFFTIEQNFDRPGYDFWNAPSGGAADCSFACQAENKCRAFTFVRPGRHDPFGRCFLKSAVPKAIRNNCCTSGVRRAAPRPID
jgi:PAN domain